MNCVDSVCEDLAFTECRSLTCILHHVDVGTNVAVLLVVLLLRCCCCC